MSLPDPYRSASVHARLSGLLRAVRVLRGQIGELQQRLGKDQGGAAG